MSEIGEMWQEVRKAQQEKRADNRENSAQYLENRGIPFVEKNGGAHLIVEGDEGYIDFWPGTGRWRTRNGRKGFGVRKLVEYINAR